MAKKDRGAEWQPPEFDEVKFMKGEMRAARATIAVVLWTLPAALVSYGLTLAGVAVVAFFAGIGMMLLLKWVMPILKIDISQYKRKDWIGHGLTFFFSWLAFWILLLNPPFADLTSPTILSITVDGANYGCGGADTNTTAPNANLLTIIAGDNVGVTRVTVNGADFPRTGREWSAPVTPGVKDIIAYDAAGHRSPLCTVGVA